LLLAILLATAACGGSSAVGHPDGGVNSDTGEVGEEGSPDTAVDGGADAGGADADAGTNQIAGDVVVVWLGSSPATLAAGQPMFFDFELSSVIFQDHVAFALGADLLEQPFTFSIVDANHAPLTPPQLVLDTGQTARFAVRVDAPAGSDGQEFLLAATAEASPSAAGTSGLIAFTVGSAAPQPDPSYTLQINGRLTNYNGATFQDGDTIVAPPGSSVIVPFDILFAQDATAPLTTSVDLLPPASGWMFDVSVQTVNIPPSRGQSVDFAVAPGDAPTAGFIRINFTNTLTQQVQSRTFAVRPD
jgi:hypothetical protein